MNALDGQDTLALIARALGCGLFIWVLLRAVAEAPPAVAAVVIAQPLAIAAGFFAIAAAEPEAFVRAAALRGAQAMPALLTFITLVAVGFARLSRPALLALGLGGWAAMALALTGVEWPFWLSCTVTLALIGASHLLFPIVPGLAARGPAGPRRRLWPAAVQGGAVVLVLGLFSSLLGPRFSAILAAVPVAMVFVTLAMKGSGTPRWAETYQSARLGLPSLLSYFGAIWALTPLIGALTACFVALLPSLLLSLMTVHLRLRLATRTVS